MKFHAVFFTDMSARIWHSRPMGAYRLATELRKHGHNVLVVDFFSKWLLNLRDLDKLLKAVISDETVFVGYSGTFFAQAAEVPEEISTVEDFYKLDTIAPWPVETKVIKLINQRIKSLSPEVKIFYGGSSANFISPQLMPSACGVDYIVQGFADSYIAEIVNNLRTKQHISFSFENNCKIIKYDVTGQKFDFNTAGQTFYHESDCLLDNEVLPLETSRGCMFKCKFCSFPLLGRKKNDKSYHKHVDCLAQEFKHNFEMFGTTRYMIADDTFNESTEKLQEVHAAIKQSGVDIKFCCCLRLDLVERFPEQIQILKDMGMQSAFLGIETLHKQSARAVGKNSDPESVKKTLELMRATLGDRCTFYASFICGLPHETEETFNQWMSWVFEHKDIIDSYRINVLALNDKNASWTSEITKYPEKYGYTFDENNKWISNTGMTHQHAEKLVAEWSKKSWDAGRLKVSSYDIMGMQNLGFSFDELKDQPLNSLPVKTIQQRYKKTFQDYQQKLFAYLSK